MQYNFRQIIISLFLIWKLNVIVFSRCFQHIGRTKQSELDLQIAVAKWIKSVIDMSDEHIFWNKIVSFSVYCFVFNIHNYF